ncbi:hypothetical protein MKW94_022458 [Papaver nudicaule]|uniref:Uncharacterized protein n=1 Tax=Papaver nudicaule TaxID=74823 RepID=A0AA41V561_PAPNU|nr:hypothetical protein [Papaver nudicaule]
MAKSHLSLSPFLIGFLLVLVFADVAYVRGQCDLHAVDTCDGANCDSFCVGASNFLVHHSSCESSVVRTRFGRVINMHECSCCRS